MSTVTRTRLLCRAEHPEARRPRRREDAGRRFARIHGVLLQVVNHPAVATGRILDKWEDVRAEEDVFGVRCQCGFITEYRRAE